MTMTMTRYMGNDIGDARQTASKYLVCADAARPRRLLLAMTKAMTMEMTMIMAI